MTKNFKFQISNFKFNNEGFTLVELLASIIVLAALGSIIAGIITSSLRGASKTTTVENIRQNGNYAISQMSKTIQYAQTFNGLSKDDEDYVLACPLSAALNGTPPVPFTTDDYRFIKVTSLDGSQIKYSCASGTLTVNTLGELPTPLVDTESFAIKSCFFSCTQTKSTDVPVIGISFELELRSSSNLAEKANPPIKFETSVVMRNYKK